MILHGAFAGWRVVEVCGGFGQAALAGKLLADLGCEVTKVEPPEGDALRSEVPTAAGALSLHDLVAGGKHPVCIDLRRPGARDPLRALLARAQVLLVDAGGLAAVESALGAGALDRGLPDLTVCICTAFGTTGPLAGWQGGEEIVQAVSGTMSITGHPGRPTRLASAVVTHSAALFAVTSILADRSRTDRPTGARRLDMCLYDAAVALLTASLPSYFLSGQAPAPIGNRHSMAAPWNTFRCTDGWVVICAGSDATWQRLCHAIGEPQMLSDPDFATQERRVAHIESLEARISAWTAVRARLEVEAVLDAEGIPCGPILPLAEVLGTPQFIERHLVATGDDGRSSGGVFHWNGEPVTGGAASGPVGGATRTILLGGCEVGTAAYERWLAEGVIHEERMRENADTTA